MDKQPEERRVTVRITYTHSATCNMLLPNQNEVQRAIRAMAKALGAPATGAEALIRAIKRIAADQESRHWWRRGIGPSIESWAWNEGTRQQAQRLGVYSPALAWADGLNFTCWRGPGGLIHLANITVNGRPMAREPLFRLMGHDPAEPISSARVEIVSPPAEEPRISVDPLWQVLGRWLREPCFINETLEGEQPQDELGIGWYDRVDPYDPLTSSTVLGERVTDAYMQEQRLVIGEDAVFYQPRYGGSPSDRVEVELYREVEGGLDLGPRYVDVYADEIRLHSLWTEGSIRAVISLSFAVAHPPMASNNASVRAVAEDLAAKLQAAYDEDLGLQHA